MSSKPRKEPTAPMIFVPIKTMKARYKEIGTILNRLADRYPNWSDLDRSEIDSLNDEADAIRRVLERHKTIARLTEGGKT